MSKEPDLVDRLDDVIEAADKAVENAQTVRSHHRRRTNRTSKQRATDCRLAREKLKTAMTPIRRGIARLPYEPLNHANEARLRAASKRIQAERRKLSKLTPINQED